MKVHFQLKPSISWSTLALARPLTFQSFLQSVSLKAWLVCFFLGDAQWTRGRVVCQNCTTDFCPNYKNPIEKYNKYIHSVPRNPARRLTFTWRHVAFSCIFLPWTCWSSWLFTSHLRVWRWWRWSFGHWWMFGGTFQRQTWGCQHWMDICDEQR